MIQIEKNVQVWDSLEDGDEVWNNDIDGDFGLKSPSKPLFRKNVYNSYHDWTNNRRQRNMKVKIIIYGLSLNTLIFSSREHQ